MISVAEYRSLFVAPAMDQLRDRPDDIPSCLMAAEAMAGLYEFATAGELDESGSEDLRDLVLLTRMASAIRRRAASILVGHSGRIYQVSLSDGTGMMQMLLDDNSVRLSLEAEGRPDRDATGLLVRLYARIGALKDPDGRALSA